MARHTQEKDQLLQVTLEFTETLDSGTRLAQAFRLILTQPPAHGPEHVTPEDQDKVDDKSKNGKQN